MMRIGVTGDTHGMGFALERALLALPGMDAWVHLGDVTSDAYALEKMAGVPVHLVRGNCDFDMRPPLESVFEFEGVRVFACHGHQYGVRYDRTRLFYRAEELHCSIAIYGHTHVPRLEASGPVLALNPGSPASPREGHAPSVALLRIEDGEAYPEIIQV